jgi:hypothetical protein
MYLAFYLAAEEVVCYCMVKRVGRPGDVPDTRNESAWKFMLCEQLLYLVGTTANLVDKDVNHCAVMFPA